MLYILKIYSIMGLHRFIIFTFCELLCSLEKYSAALSRRICWLWGARSTSPTFLRLRAGVSCQMQFDRYGTEAFYRQWGIVAIIAPTQAMATICTYITCVSSTPLIYCDMSAVTIAMAYRFLLQWGCSGYPVPYFSVHS